MKLAPAVLAATVALGAIATATQGHGKPAGDPVFGESVVVEPRGGEVLVATEPGRPFTPLRNERQVPVGALLDTRAGVVALASARAPQGATQSGRFSGGLFRAGLFRAFQPLQGDSGLTVLRLAEGGFQSCDARGPYARAVIRRLRANANGHFRTRGRYSSATASGTEWTTTDRCDGTLTIVKGGTVVVRDRARKRSVRLAAGERYLARGAG